MRASEFQQETARHMEADNLDAVLRIVARETGISKTMLLSKRRTHTVSQARFIAYYLLHRSGHNMVDIAWMLNRTDHSTVSHGVNVVRRWLKLGGIVGRSIRQMADELKLEVN